jgi:hypothetical protein
LNGKFKNNKKISFLYIENIFTMMMNFSVIKKKSAPPIQFEKHSREPLLLYKSQSPTFGKNIHTLFGSSIFERISGSQCSPCQGTL